MTKDRPCLAFSDKFSSHPEILTRHFRGRTGPSRFPDSPVETAALTLQNKPQTSKPGSALSHPGTARRGRHPVEPAAFLSTHTALGAAFSHFFPLQKPSGVSLAQSRLRQLLRGRTRKAATHSTRVIPAHLHPRVQVGGCGTVEDKSLAMEQSHRASRAYADI